MYVEAVLAVLIPSVKVMPEKVSLDINGATFFQPRLADEQLVTEEAPRAPQVI